MQRYRQYVFGRLVFPHHADGCRGGSYINVSLNELTSLLKRSFEGLGYCQGVYEDAAATVVWLESHGMHGIEILASAWPELPAAVGPKLISNTSGRRIMDASQTNVALCGRTAVELVSAEAAAGGSGQIELRQCHGQVAILPSLSLCAARGLHAIAHWHDDDHLYIASINAGIQHPISGFGKDSLMMTPA